MDLAGVIATAFSEYCIKHHLEQIVDLLLKDDVMQHYSIVINFVTLFEENIDLGNAILGESEQVIPLFDNALVVAQKNVIDTVFSSDTQQSYSVKSKVHARITGLPSTLETHRTAFPKNDALGNFLKVSGTVVKVTLPKLLEFQKEFSCSKCGETRMVEANFNLCNVIVPPTVCANLCVPSTLTAIKTDAGGRYKDYQEIKLQEEVGKLSVGNIPSSIWITLDNDLVDTCHPGDHVTVWGTAMRRWRSLHHETRGDVELVVKANNLQVSNDQKSARLITDEATTKFHEFWKVYATNPLVGRDIILASFCPNVYGLYLVKLALCIVLAGGVPRREEGGSFVRAEPHLLLVGDPGTGKSHLLRFAAKTSSRSVLTTGVGSTSAGLTVCAVREGSDWQLEAGALVLADGGVCCIDELNSIREQDRTSIHEAMEQQTISVAKAGMVTKLNTRCSVLAATNAKGAYDPAESISVNVALASPLLSRFDLVLVLQDTRSQDWDKLLSNFILELSSPSVLNSDNLWSLETLQSYFALVKTNHPVSTAAANTVLSRYYQAQRAADSRNAARTTVRMLESLVRLSQGHARLLMRNEVTLLDAVVAVTLMECSMQGSSLISAGNALHAAFPDDPQEQYKHQMSLVLRKLGLENLLSQELLRLAQDSKELDLERLQRTNNLPKCINDKPELNIEFSQRLTDVLTGIKKKRDRDMCHAANIGCETKLPKPRKRLRKITDTDEDEEIVAHCVPSKVKKKEKLKKMVCDESPKMGEINCGNECKRVEKDNNINSFAKGANKSLPNEDNQSDNPEETILNSSSDGTDKTSKLGTSTSKKLFNFKYVKRSKDPIDLPCEESRLSDERNCKLRVSIRSNDTDEITPLKSPDGSRIEKPKKAFSDDDVIPPTPIVCQPSKLRSKKSLRLKDTSCIVTSTPIPLNASHSFLAPSCISSINAKEMDRTSDFRLGKPVGTSTPFVGTSSTLNVRKQPKDDKLGQINVCNLIERLSKKDDPQPSSSVVATSFTDCDTVIVPSPLITQSSSIKNRSFNSEKLKALAKIGRELSMSQSSSRSNSQSQQQGSQFSLKEMSWDDVDLEL